jgi:hypothetical protein
VTRACAHKGRVSVSTSEGEQAEHGRGQQMQEQAALGTAAAGCNQSQTTADTNLVGKRAGAHDSLDARHLGPDGAIAPQGLLRRDSGVLGCLARRCKVSATQTQCAVRLNRPSGNRTLRQLGENDPRATGATRVSPGVAAPRDRGDPTPAPAAPAPAVPIEVDRSLMTSGLSHVPCNTTTHE